MKTWRHLSPLAFFRTCKARVPIFLKSLVTLFLFSILLFSSKTFGQSTGAVPCNAHRWLDGDGWRLINSNWTIEVNPNDLPKGIVPCEPSGGASTESGLQAYAHVYDPSEFAISSDQGQPNSGDQVIWLNFDVRAFAGSFEYQLGIGGASTGDLKWALYYSNAFTPGLNSNGLSGDCTDLTSTPTTSGIVDNGWLALNVPKFSQPTNYYIAIWSTTGSVLDKDINFKARKGCGQIPVSCIIEKSGTTSTTCNGDGTYTVCQDFVGANGKWTITDNAVVKAISYDVKTYELDGTTVLDHFTSTDLSTTPIAFELSNLGSGGPIKATVCVTYSVGNNYDVSLTGSGIDNPPANYSCTANEGFSGTGLTQVATPSATVTQPDCFTSTGTVEVTNPIDGVTYTLSNADHSYTADANGLFSDVPPGSYVLTASLSGSCSSNGTDNVVVDDAPGTVDAPVAAVASQPDCTTATGTVQVTDPVDGVTYTLTGLTSYTADANGLFSGVLPGTYTLNASTGSCTADGSDKVVIDPQPPTPTATISGGSFCKTGSTQLNVTSGPTGGTFSATPAGLSISSSGLIDLAASKADTYIVTYSFTDGTCSNTTTSPVTVKPLPTASIAVGAQSCTGGVAKFTLTATTNGTSLTWSTSGDGSFTSTNSSPTVYTPGNNDKANGVTITLSTSLNYCSNSATTTLKTTPCGPFYSLTQGFYGNVGGKVCTPAGYFTAGTKSTVPGLIETSISNMPGGKLILGSATKSFTMGSTAPEATNLIKYMPGSKTPDKLAGIYNITNALPPLYNKKIANVFLTQSITLALNISIPNNTLGSFVLQPGYLTTQKADPATCPSTKILACSKDASAISSLKITSNANLMNVLANQTVDSLLRLASKVLGGGALPAGVTISDINNAVDVVNKSFDGGRFVLGYYGTQQSCSSLAAATIVSSVSVGTQSITVSKLSVKTYPNPYTNAVNFSVVSPVSGKAVLEAYNMLGQRVAIIFNGNVDAGVQNNFKYNVPAGNRVPMIYKLTIGDKTYHGTIIPAR